MLKNEETNNEITAKKEIVNYVFISLNLYCTGYSLGSKPRALIGQFWVGDKNHSHNRVSL